MNCVENMDYNIDMLSLHKMLFIYNAIINGWTVKQISKNNFEFVKNKKKVKKEIFLDNFLKYFTKNNLDINTIINTN